MIKILIVEDEVPQQLLYKAELEDEGYRVETAGTADEARKKISDFKPDIVIVDIQIPGQTGLEWMSEVLENEKIPFIINSAYSHYKDDFSSWAADEYVVKSSDLTELKEAIRRVIKQHKLK
ncbi:MAG: response regulator [Calditrichia bacterium]